MGVAYHVQAHSRQKKMKQFYNPLYSDYLPAHLDELWFIFPVKIKIH